MPTNSAIPATLLSAAALHWRSFIFMWIWPAFFYLSWLALGALGALSSNTSTTLWFFLFQAPVFFISSYISATPARKKVVSVGQHIFWTMLIPISIWVVLVFLPFGMLYALEQL